MAQASNKRNKTRRTIPRRPKAEGLHDARLEFRLPSAVRERIEKAALVSGQSLSDFASSILLREADAVLERHHTRVLSERDWARFVELLTNPPIPTPALHRAAAAYNQLARHDGETTIINLEDWATTLPEEDLTDPH